MVQSSKGRGPEGGVNYICVGLVGVCSPCARRAGAGWAAPPAAACPKARTGAPSSAAAARTSSRTPAAAPRAAVPCGAGAACAASPPPAPSCRPGDGGAKGGGQGHSEQAGQARPSSSSGRSQHACMQRSLAWRLPARGCRPAQAAFHSAHREGNLARCAGRSRLPPPWGVRQRGSSRQLCGTFSSARPNISRSPPRVTVGHGGPGGKWWGCGRATTSRSTRGVAQPGPTRTPAGVVHPAPRCSMNSAGCRRACKLPGLIDEAVCGGAHCGSAGSP